LAIMPDVIEDHQRTIRPTAQDRTIQSKRLYHCMHVVRPQLRARVASERLVRLAMPTHVHRHQAVALSKVGGHLPGPLQPTLRHAVNVKNRAPLRVSRLSHVEVRASTASDFMQSHDGPPLNA